MAELKARLSEYLAKVKAGEDVLVTERGYPIARLVPISGTGNTHDAEHAERARLLAMEREGLVRLGKGDAAEVLRRTGRPKDPAAGVRAALVEDRRTGR